jgi:hypothetical protein
MIVLPRLFVIHHNLIACQTFSVTRLKIRRWWSLVAQFLWTIETSDRNSSHFDFLWVDSAALTTSNAC